MSNKIKRGDSPAGRWAGLVSAREDVHYVNAPR